MWPYPVPELFYICLHLLLCILPEFHPCHFALEWRTISCSSTQQWVPLEGVVRLFSSFQLGGVTLYCSWVIFWHEVLSFAYICCYVFCLSFIPVISHWSVAPYHILVPAMSTSWGSCLAVFVISTGVCDHILFLGCSPTLRMFPTSAIKYSVWVSSLSFCIGVSHHVSYHVLAPVESTTPESCLGERHILLDKASWNPADGFCSWCASQARLCEAFVLMG